MVESAIQHLLQSVTRAGARIRHEWNSRPSRLPLITLLLSYLSLAKSAKETCWPLLSPAMGGRGLPQ